MQHTGEQIVHVPVPQIQEQIVESVQVIPRELFPGRIEEQIVYMPAPPIVQEIAEVVQNFPQERFQQSTVEQSVVVPVPQVLEKQLVVEETTQTSVEIRTEVEYVAPAPDASFAALHPAVLDGFQQALVGIGASDLNTLTKEQLELDAFIKVILWYSKQFKIFFENAQKLYDLSKAKLGDLLRVQQAFARPHKAARRVSVDSARDGTSGSPGRDTHTEHRVKTYHGSIPTTHVKVILCESMLATYVDVMSYESTLDETAFAMVHKSCIAGADSRILGHADTMSCP